MQGVQDAPDGKRHSGKGRYNTRIREVLFQ